MSSPSSLRTPLARVRGRGSAKSGTGHFIAQRVSAILIALLTPYLLISAACSLGPGYDAAREWVMLPWIAAPLALFVVASCYHMQIGMQVIIEDYIEKPLTRAVLGILNVFAALAVAVVAVFAILKIFLGA